MAKGRKIGNQKTLIQTGGGGNWKISGQSKSSSTRKIRRFLSQQLARPRVGDMGVQLGKLAAKRTTQSLK